MEKSKAILQSLLPVVMWLAIQSVVSLVFLFWRDYPPSVSYTHLDVYKRQVTDFVEIAGYGVMSTPALVIDGEVISYGKVLKVEEVKELLMK